MGRRYTASGSAAVGTDKTIITVVSATTIRPEVQEIVVGCSATPADQAGKFLVQRFTAAGTAGSSPTPEPHDPNDPAALAAAGAGVFTVEPTYTSGKILLTLGLHQRASFRWAASPGRGLKAPATAANGLGLKSSANTGTASHDGCLMWEE